MALLFKVELLTEPAIQSVLQRLRRLADRHVSPGLQYVFFDADKTLIQFSEGLADVEKQVPVSSASFYPVYSVTKTFTALAILKLEEMGKIKIDDFAYRYIPHFPYPRDITIKNLLTHSAGIPNPVPLNWIHLETEHATFDQRAFFDRLFKEHNKLLFAPNKKFRYSNLGYVLLGRLIENVSGKPYEQFMVDEIFKTLDPMLNTLRFDLPTGASRVVGYHRRFGFSYVLLSLLIDTKKYMGKPVGKWRPFKRFHLNGTAYGGVIATVDGLQNFIQQLLKKESVLISSEARSKLFQENMLMSGKHTGMCLSWFTGHVNGIRYYTHAGGGGGFYCEVRLYPDLNVGSIILLNSSGMRDRRMLDNIDALTLSTQRSRY